MTYIPFKSEDIVDKIYTILCRCLSNIHEPIPQKEEILIKRYTINENNTNTVIYNVRIRQRPKCYNILYDDLEKAWFVSGYGITNNHVNYK